MYRAVVDVNVVLSSLIGGAEGPSGQIMAAVAAGQVRQVVSPKYLAELHDTLHRPRFRRWFSVATASRTVIEARRRAEHHQDYASVVSITRDPKDDYLVQLARTARADCVVTGDKDLHSADLPDVWVLTPASFLAEFRRAE